MPKAREMTRRFPDLLDPAAIGRVVSMYTFDEAVTAPLHGFAGTNDYWTRASSKPWLAAIAVPTLVLNARNDPFIPASSLPTRAEASRAVTLEHPEHGGHAGFPHVAGRLDWLPRRVLRFFQGS
jgi:predicted alpha/beta-fold hydrolase